MVFEFYLKGLLEVMFAGHCLVFFVREYVEASRTDPARLIARLIMHAGRFILCLGMCIVIYATINLGKSCILTYRDADSRRVGVRQVLL